MDSDSIGTERPDNPNQAVGLLLSGGLDSSILLIHFLKNSWRIRPFYVRCGLYWESAEALAVSRYLNAVEGPNLEPLVTLELPVRDIYGQHWSVTGHGIPAFDSADQAMFLPGRNALLIMKAALWCQLHQIPDLALATLQSNPFPDASPQFFDEFESALKIALSIPVRILRPFEKLDKRQVMNLGRDAPLELTFSCVAPIDGRHCGNCNKCRERQRAFGLVGLHDPTIYFHRFPDKKC